MPSIDGLYGEYRARGFEVLLVNIGEPEGRVRETVKERGYGMRAVLDSRSEVSRRYAIRGTPTVFLLDREGQVVTRAIGMRDWASPKGRAVLDALLAEGR